MRECFSICTCVLSERLCVRVCVSRLFSIDFGAYESARKSWVFQRCAWNLRHDCVHSGSVKRIYAQIKVYLWRARGGRKYVHIFVLVVLCAKQVRLSYAVSCVCTFFMQHSRSHATARVHKHACTCSVRVGDARRHKQSNVITKQYTSSSVLHRTTQKAYYQTIAHTVLCIVYTFVYK